MRLNTLVLPLLLVFWSGIAVAQNDPAIPLLAALNSTSATARETAFYSLIKLGNQSQANSTDNSGISSGLTGLLSSYPYDAEKIKLAFINLLSTEMVAAVDEDGADPSSTVSAETDYGVYYSDLETAVVALDDVRSLPLLVQLLNSGNMFINRVVSFGPVALDPVLTTIYDPRPEIHDAATFPLVKMTDPANSAVFRDPTSVSKIRAGLMHLSNLLDIPAMQQFAQTGLRRLPAVPAGDLNGDGLVNCPDLALIKASFGKSVGQTGFDIRADVNGDGVVNILDLSAEAKLMPAGTKCQ